MKIKRPTITQLHKKAWKNFSLAIRYRDSEWLGGQWVGRCITCDQTVIKGDGNGGAGHFMSAMYENTRYNYENVNLQCRKCNVLFKGQQYKHGLAIDKKYGDGTAARLEKEAFRRPFTVTELEEIIHDAQEEIKFYESIAKEAPLLTKAPHSAK